MIMISNFLKSEQLLIEPLYAFKYLLALSPLVDPMRWNFAHISKGIPGENSLSDSDTEIDHGGDGGKRQRMEGRATFEGDAKSEIAAHCAFLKIYISPSSEHGR